MDTIIHNYCYDCMCGACNKKTEHFGNNYIIVRCKKLLLTKCLLLNKFILCQFLFSEENFKLLSLHDLAPYFHIMSYCNI